MGTESNKEKEYEYFYMGIGNDIYYCCRYQGTIYMVKEDQ